MIHLHTGDRMKSIVAERGQGTILKALRDELGIRSGTALEFPARNGTLIAHKAETNPVASVYGCLKRGSDTDRLIARLRGVADK